jgi:hypothetical protein
MAPADAPTRQALHAYLTEDAHRGWQTFAEENGVSVTSLCEVYGADLMEAALADDDRYRDLVKRARKVDVQRRRRG